MRTVRTFPVRALAALLSTCTTAACSWSPSESSPPSTTSSGAASTVEFDEAATRSDDVLERTLATDEPGCSAAVGIEGEVVRTGARGVADMGTGAPLDDSTTFHVGSVTKQFTATAVLLLALDDELSLENEIARWAPELPAWSREVTQVADPVEIGAGVVYAAGIVIRRDIGLWHGGEWAGQIADFSVAPDRRTAVAVACNSFAGSTSDLDHIANDLRAEWFD